MVDINFGNVPQPQIEPTICGPVSDFKDLTLSSNAIQLGWLGFFAGILVPIIAAFGYFYVAPRVIAYGQTKGWWT